MRVTDLIPWKPARSAVPNVRGERDPVTALQNDVNRAFDDFVRLFPAPFSGWPNPILDTGASVKVDVAETEKEVKVTAELPGINEAEIDVRVSDGMLVVSGEKRADRGVEESGYFLRERSFGRVERSVPLPDDIDADAAQANFKCGVLTVVIPKKLASQSGAKRISVKSE